jgi:type III restriction enzyme
MKLRFKQQQYQIDAVEAVVDCFESQPLLDARKYRLDPGRIARGQNVSFEFDEGFRNQDILLTSEAVLKNLQAVQRRQNLPISPALASTPTSKINLDVEMETGTGKTYCYTRTAFELNRRYGWSKFIVVVPSIAIREGVFQSLTDTTDHFLEIYGKKARFFVYNSRSLHDLESFSSDASVNIMIMNVQAYASKSESARRIFLELDDFQTRKPIDVIRRNRPIMILDEPQKMGERSEERLKDFDPLFVLRYSATHRKEHNKIHRLDALDAYNQKLVKKIAVRGVKAKGLAGTNAYLYLERIEISPSKPPVARMEMEIRGKQGIRKEWRVLGKGDNLFDKSGELDQYHGYVLSDIRATDGVVEFTNGEILTTGEAAGDVTESALRRIQIREAIQAHFEKERELFQRGIKVLTLFFIDEVAKYRQYTDEGERPGEYVKFFEEEYNLQLNEILNLHDGAYTDYLKGIDTAKTHDGYFSQDKKTGRMVNPERAAKSDESDDQSAYDKILRDKAGLLSFQKPIRFIFSHSALREGWDNPNVFVIGMLKHSDNNISRRQEVGRGMRLAVNQNGDRMDDPASVHQVNILTVVASEGYKDFVAGLQKDMVEALSARPKKADTEYFKGKIIKTETGDVEVTEKVAQLLSAYLLINGYTDDKHLITAAYHEAKASGSVAALPAPLVPHAIELFKLVDSVFSPSQLPEIEDERKVKTNKLNANFEKKAFRELWNRIHTKAVYTVSFETGELTEKCVAALDADLKVAPLQYIVERGQQTDTTTYEALRGGYGFVVPQTQTQTLTTSIQSEVSYDLLGKLAEATQLTRRTIGAILHKIAPSQFALYKVNPEDFLRVVARLINEQKAAVIVDHLIYSPTEQSYTIDIFAHEKPKADFSKAVEVQHHIYDYVFTDAGTEREFVKALDKGTEVEVYAKLPRSFFIPTPVGHYSPDWAIAFKDGTVKHIYFVAETKGSLSSLDLRKIEEFKIECAKRFFAKISSDQVKYDVVDSYDKLMQLVH